MIATHSRTLELSVTDAADKPVVSDRITAKVVSAETGLPLPTVYSNVRKFGMYTREMLALRKAFAEHVRESRQMLKTLNNA